jgi:DNA-binding XRE family transcriptional regulator
LSLRAVLERILEEKGMKKADLARIVGVTPQSLNSWMAKDNPKMDTLQRIATALSVPVSALMEDEDPGETVVLAPVYKSLRCGGDKGGTGVTGEVFDRLPVPAETTPRGLFGIVAVGDSMAGPPSWIHDGTYVMFRPCEPDHIPDGKVCCLTVEGYADPLCKRIRIEPTGLVLVSDNHAYPPVFVGPNQCVVCHGVWYGTWQPAPKNGVMQTAPI